MIIIFFKFKFKWITFHCYLNHYLPWETKVLHFFLPVLFNSSNLKMDLINVKLISRGQNSSGLKVTIILMVVERRSPGVLGLMNQIFHGRPRTFYKWEGDWYLLWESSLNHLLHSSGDSEGCIAFSDLGVSEDWTISFLL